MNRLCCQDNDANTSAVLMDTIQQLEEAEKTKRANKKREDGSQRIASLRTRLTLANTELKALCENAEQLSQPEKEKEKEIEQLMHELSDEQHQIGVRTIDESAIAGHKLKLKKWPRQDEVVLCHVLRITEESKAQDSITNQAWVAAPAEDNSNDDFVNNILLNNPEDLQEAFLVIDSVLKALDTGSGQSNDVIVLQKACDVMERAIKRAKTVRGSNTCSAPEASINQLHTELKQAMDLFPRHIRQAVEQVLKDGTAVSHCEKVAHMLNAMRAVPGHSVLLISCNTDKQEHLHLEEEVTRIESIFKGSNLPEFNLQVWARHNAGSISSLHRCYEMFRLILFTINYSLQRKSSQ